MSGVLLRFRPRAVRPKCGSCGVPLHPHEIDARIDGSAREGDEQAMCWQCDWYEDTYQQTRRAVEADARRRELEEARDPCCR